MRISDWSSDVCSSDLHGSPAAIPGPDRGGAAGDGPPGRARRRTLFPRALRPPLAGVLRQHRPGDRVMWVWLSGFLVIGYLSLTRSFAYLGVPPLTIFIGEIALALFIVLRPGEIGRASCRERVCQYG